MSPSINTLNDITKLNRTKIIILAAYFGRWPVWFPAFLLSCAKNESIDWLFFTDCVIPNTHFDNIHFEQMNLRQLNELASKKIGIPVKKKAYSQVDLQPAYGVIFDEHIKGYDFWGHCDIDIIWGDIRAFISEEVLQNYDIVSCRKDFLAGHLALWKNAPETNNLFRSVPAYRALFASAECFSFDEAVISTFLRALEATDNGKVRVHWPEDMVTWFRRVSTPQGWQWAATPIGWYWENGKIFDMQGRENVYVHFQHWKKSVTSIDFQLGVQPARFEFTRSGIRAGRPSVIERFNDKHGGIQHKRLFSNFKYVPKELLRLLKRVVVVEDLFWARQLVINSISADDVKYDRKTHRLLFKRLDLQIKKQEHGFLEHYHTALLLVDKRQAKFFRNSQDKLIVEVAELYIAIEGYGEITTLKELLIDGIYNVQFPRPAVVLDIGMHTGLTTIFLASQPGIVAVGCEPCRHIYRQALRNMALNPVVSDKILTFNAGIGEANYESIAGYLPKPRARSHLLAPHHRDYDVSLKFEYEEIEIKDVAQMVDFVVAEYPEREVVLKIDLERSEYYIDGVTDQRIINRLYETGKLAFIDTIMLRLHRRSAGNQPTIIIEQLRDFGFNVFPFKPFDHQGGMIYAVRSTTQRSSPRLKFSLHQSGEAIHE